MYVSSHTHACMYTRTHVYREIYGLAKKISYIKTCISWLLHAQPGSNTSFW